MLPYSTGGARAEHAGCNLTGLASQFDELIAKQLEFPDTVLRRADEVIT